MSMYRPNKIVKAQLELTIDYLLKYELPIEEIYVYHPATGVVLGYNQGTIHSVDMPDADEDGNVYHYAVTIHNHPESMSTMSRADWISTLICHDLMAVTVGRKSISVLHIDPTITDDRRREVFEAVRAFGDMAEMESSGGREAYIDVLTAAELGWLAIANMFPEVEYYTIWL